MFLANNEVGILRNSLSTLFLEERITIMCPSGKRTSLDPLEYLAKNLELDVQEYYQLTRDYQVKSFADGLFFSGKTVWVQNHGQQKYRHRPYKKYVPHYFLLGLAWSCGTLPRLFQLMRAVQYGYRLDIWYATGMYYHTKPSEMRTNPPKLIIVLVTVLFRISRFFATAFLKRS